MLKFLIKYREREKEVLIPIGFFIFSFLWLHCHRECVDVLVSVKLGCPVLAQGSADGDSYKIGKDLGNAFGIHSYGEAVPDPALLGILCGRHRLGDNIHFLRMVLSLQGFHVCFCIPCAALCCDWLRAQPL